MSASADVFAVSAVTVARGFKAVDPEERQLRNLSAHDDHDVGRWTHDNLDAWHNNHVRSLRVVSG